MAAIWLLSWLKADVGASAFFRCLLNNRDPPKRAANKRIIAKNCDSQLDIAIFCDFRMMAEFDYPDVIKRILQKNRWRTEGDLAKALGIAPNTWTSYKRGDSSFSLKDIAKICDILGVSAHWLLFGEELPDGSRASFQTQTTGSSGSQFFVDTPPIGGTGSLSHLSRDEIGIITGGRIMSHAFADVGRAVRDCYAAASIKIPEHLEDEMIANAYNELVGVGVDFSDEEEIAAHIVLLRKRLAKELAAARKDPGTGKRSA